MRTAHSSSVSPSGRRGRAIREAAWIPQERIPWGGYRGEDTVGRIPWGGYHREDTVGRIPWGGYRGEDTVGGGTVGGGIVGR